MLTWGYRKLAYLMPLMAIQLVRKFIDLYVHKIAILTETQKSRSLIFTAGVLVTVSHI
jgi:hypothetical protein